MSIPTLTLTPSGQVIFLPGGGDSPALPDAAAARIAAAFHEDAAAGLLHLAAEELTTPLPPDFAFWRDFSRRCLTQLCRIAAVESEGPDFAAPPPSPEDLLRIVETSPPLQGLEYLSPAVLENLWTALQDRTRSEAGKAGGSVQDYLKNRNPLWNMVGRVVFHLAENRKNEERPFGFLITYTTRLSGLAKPQFLPLGKAFREFASAQDRGGLLALLTPLQRAAEASALIRELVDSGQIFHPLAWTVRETCRFLDDIPRFESSGILVRIPEAWRDRGRPPRPQVSVTVGARQSGGLGLDALLDFSVGLTLDGEELTGEERRRILSETSGLVLLRGKWVEIDREKIAALLSHWEKRKEAEAGEGISFTEGMRLLAGAELADRDALPDAEASREWLNADAGEWLRSILAGMRSPEGMIPADPGPALKTQLRPYQMTGVAWLRFMHDLGLGSCLADDMGLGKTIQILALLLILRQRKASESPSSSGPAILIVPASLVANWKAEIGRFAPSLVAFYAHPSETPAADLAVMARAEGRSATLSEADLIVTTYAMVHRMAWLRETVWGLIILDEAQAVKNPGARQTRAVKSLKGKRRIILTGTPLENRLGDLWSLFDFLSPGLLGTEKVFSRYVKGTPDRKDNAYAALRALVRPYILRRLKTDRRIIADLPDKTEVRVFCPLTKTQAALYEESVREMAGKLKEARGIQRRGLVLAYLMRFKQICNHPSQWLGDQAYGTGASGKFQRLRVLCEEIASRQEKLLVFTQFREMTEPLAALLAETFLRPGLVLHGGTGVGKRREIVEAFQREEGPPFFVLSLKAGGVGLNLTAASHVIHFDRWWNPAVENQATDRAFRIGQKKNVLVHKFVCRGTVEEKIDALIEDKKELVESILGGDREKLVTEMPDEELIRFVSLDLSRALDEENNGKKKMDRRNSG
ncbi:MAG TPA: DEAD/DEAH box helicase [Smithellaceae bacterium]|jgi:non-specific serine/threonine protein kinase|nr:DEAD/DEAH box helicase [Syntrophaceae bacterium]NMC91841.1 DEAD/DEAH box helicase [Smithella sp.]HOE23116.1 DEAD/DEAH box helicase [Smithellaceae bacterium]HOR62828.1 DEAD/DEAH box helicase [Smithellaceae bacterium]HOU56572.1 DEAD/DEAH box helicase [Smithellaceae bacterium]